MNDDLSRSWQILVVVAMVQTGLLLLACALINHWASRINRKLRNIESALSPERPGPARHTGAGGNNMYVSRRKHSHESE